MALAAGRWRWPCIALLLPLTLSQELLDFDAPPGEQPKAGSDEAPRVASSRLPSWPLDIRVCAHERGGSCACKLPGTLVGESWSSKRVRAFDRGRGAAIIGGSRAFYSKAVLGTHNSWDAVQYEKLFLLGRSLSFTVDLSEVGCGCNAAVYLVQMTKPSRTGSTYCDIQGRFDDDAHR